MANKMVLTLAAGLSRKMEDGYREYLDACEQDRRNGHRPHYCEHGTNGWTDYDNICGPCEDGWTARDGVMRRTWALSDAHKRVDKAQKILDATTTLRELGVDVSDVTFKRFAALLTP